MRTRIAICLMSLLTVFAGPAWAGDNNPDPPPDEDVNCPDDTTEMENGSCETEPGEQCPEGWTTTGMDPGGPGPDDSTYECACEGTTDPLGNCTPDPDQMDCTDGYIELEGQDTCVLDPNDVDGLGQNGNPCPAGFEQVGGDEWGICYCPSGSTSNGGAICNNFGGDVEMSCAFGAPTCEQFGTPNNNYTTCWCSNCPDGWEMAQDTDVCVPTDYGGYPVNPPDNIMVWGQNHIERLDFDSVHEGYWPSSQVHWYTSTDLCVIGEVMYEGSCVEACTIWEVPCLGDPNTFYIYDPKIWIYE